MEDLDLSKIKKIFFVGIGGIGISAIARMTLLEGKEVLGSDISDNEVTHELRELGISIVLGQNFDLIPKDADLIVYTIAIEYYDPEFFKKIKECGIPAFSYPEMLHIVTNKKYTIAVSGTHGKTTTTGMIAHLLRENKMDPTVIIGSLLIGEKTNFIAGKSDYFVVEACEYRRSFLNINPSILVITNIEADHLDYYKDIEDIKNAFHELAMKIPESGFVICNLSDQNIKEVVSGIKAKVIDYDSFIPKQGSLMVPGGHNRLNAGAALAVGSVLQIENQKAIDTLSSFKGTWRRLEKKGITDKGTVVYDDYAHHPTEIKASLEALRELYPSSAKATAGKPNNKITVLFQPHLYSRTKALFDDFAKSFDGADQVFLLPIYFAREDKDESVSSEKLAEAVSANGVSAQAFSDFQQAEEYIKGLDFGPDDIFVTMGAGEAYKVTDKIFKLI